MYVLDAIKKKPYLESGAHPPYSGPPRPREPVRPDPNGHFAHLRAGTRAFSAAMIFATVRCVLEIWERYFGRELRWYFHDRYRRLEIIPRVEGDNAWSKPGYLECGYDDFPGRSKPFGENFDAVAHEVGHAIVRQAVRNPIDPRPLGYRAFEEASADLVAIVSSLHFEPVVNYLLERTRGDLFSKNVLSRVVELSRSDQVRVAFNKHRMSKVKWDAVEDSYKYDLAAPFTGGAFDVMVKIYQHHLVRREAIPREVAGRSYRLVHRKDARVQRKLSRAFKENRKIFREALFDARDHFGRLLARTWSRTSMQDASYLKVVANMIDADAELGGGEYRSAIRESFGWREIVPRESW